MAAAVSVQSEKKKGGPSGHASDCQKTLQGGSEGRSPLSCIPNPATCAVDSEALRSKVSLRVSPAALKAQGKRVLSEKIAVGELFRQAGAGGNARFFIFI